MLSRRSTSAAVWPAEAAATAAVVVVMSLLAVPAYGQTRLCQTPTPTLDGGRCTPERSVCVIRLEIDYRLTLTKSDTTGLFVHDYAIYKNSREPPLPDEELRDVVVADGVHPYRLVTVVNDSMPGPCLKFYTNQTVKIHVVNKLPSESLTIHWHGLDMFNNSYMDGVSLVSQCPIHPGTTFVYSVKARQPGSYWYHSHIGAQRSMGILGPLVVHAGSRAEAMPERVMVLQDWNHDFTSDRVELGSYEYRDGKMDKLKPTKSLDDADFSPFPFHSGLINGRGRHLTTSRGFTAKTPLEVFEVEEGMSYRFRVIGAGVIHPFRVSVEGHRMTVVASDAHDFEPVPAESFIINPGERFDFILVANQTAFNYMILAQTLEVGLPLEGSHVAEAVLHYRNAPKAAVARMRESQYRPTNGAARGCLDSNPCVVVNCPYSYYPEEDNTRCVHLGDLTTGNLDGRAPDSSNIKEIFLNFGFPGPGPASINGIEFQRPPVAAILHPDAIPNRCPNCGPDQLCQCTHTVSLDRNRVHQIVLLNLGSGAGFAHPVHIHGYSFYVVKMGYPVYDVTTGKMLEDNEDVACEDEFCNVARWRNQSWEPSDVQGLNLLNPVRKDTIIVPTGGYVIVRLKADNPGMWFVHCHIELHHLGGMALILDGSQGGLPPPPPGFPDCGNFHGTTGDSSSEDDSSSGGYKLWIVVVAGLGGAGLGFLIGVTCVCICWKCRGKK